MRTRRKEIGYMAFLLILLGGAIVLAASRGAVSIPPATTLRIILSKIFNSNPSFGDHFPETYEVILFKVRFPRVVLAALVGIALATSGVVFQGIFKNPMADPYIIGVSSGAALGATLAAIVFKGFGLFGFSLIPLLAFIGAVLTSFAVYNLARVGTRVPVSTLLLSGIAIGAFLHALTSFVMVFGTKDLHFIIFWLMGGFSAKNWDHVRIMTPFLLIGLPLVFYYSRDLNVLLLGEERAQQLGIEVERLKKLLIAAASLLAAAAVAVSGIVGFVGLIIPHIVRLVTGPNHKILIPCSALFGASFVVFADLLARTIMPPLEIPVGIITALFGAPFFVYLLKKGKKMF
ncbi:MAG: iron chelate uptake ABC transporter family permease subunit [Actinomycetota bacterium]|nr:iron chelate uptake ABC transporter family permease subunit [Actinomycetota bacterium]